MKDKENQIEVKKLVNIITKIYPNKYSIEYPAKAIRLANELLERYQPKLPEDSVVLTMTEHAKLVSQVRDEFEHEYKDKVVLSREKYEKLKTQLKIKTNEAEWRADQLQALDKDFELLEKVVKCKDCKWLEEKHYEEDNEKPYTKLVCKLTKRQCRLYDFCSYGEEK